MGDGIDREGFDRSIAEQIPAALRFAVKLTGNAESAEELVGEALYRAARGWRGYRADASLRTWLFRIVVNAFRDTLQTKGAGHEAIGELPDGRQPDPSNVAMAGELEARIAELVSALPPREREVLVLIVYEQLDPAEVADMLGISRANVYVTLANGRARLKRQLAPYWASK